MSNLLKIIIFLIIICCLTFSHLNSSSATQLQNTGKQNPTSSNSNQNFSPDNSTIQLDNYIKNKILEEWSVKADHAKQIDQSVMILGLLFTLAAIIYPIIFAFLIAYYEKKKSKREAESIKLLEKMEQNLKKEIKHELLNIKMDVLNESTITNLREGLKQQIINQRDSFEEEFTNFQSNLHSSLKEHVKDIDERLIKMDSVIWESWQLICPSFLHNINNRNFEEILRTINNFFEFKRALHQLISFEKADIFEGLGIIISRIPKEMVPPNFSNLVSLLHEQKRLKHLNMALMLDRLEKMGYLEDKRD
ncbi:hypothetical protein [Desulfosudis oleivorans]|uniref:Uncharacterized protein n=1 Tax=Desulfosudis oleivorans (strain DSM 6200 / JCM 39069 / Hxd3) TaxID=96561 RepID=A8ZZS6_DESOH|nr:hypothetical protein [Desulfosudis oleivorans]ABW68948.1 hypothetical protein Dole_3145 [Desulfosudis oleivorans Hxd3]